MAISVKCRAKLKWGGRRGLGAVPGVDRLAGRRRVQVLAMPSNARRESFLVI